LCQSGPWSGNWTHSYSLECRVCYTSNVLNDYFIILDIPRSFYRPRWLQAIQEGNITSTDRLYIGYNTIRAAQLCLHVDRSKSAISQINQLVLSPRILATSNCCEKWNQSGNLNVLKAHIGSAFILDIKVWGEKTELKTPLNYLSFRVAKTVQITCAN